MEPQPSLPLALTASMWGPSAAIHRDAAHAATSPAQRAASRLDALLAFLAASGARTARLVPADMLRLSTDAVSRAEAAMVAAYPSAAAAAARPTSAAERERGGRDVRPQLEVSVPRRGVVAPLGPAVMLGGLTAAHAPGERVLLLRGAGPAPFGARGLVLASQGGTCEVRPPALPAPLPTYLAAPSCVPPHLLHAARLEGKPLLWLYPPPSPCSRAPRTCHSGLRSSRVRVRVATAPWL